MTQSFDLNRKRIRPHSSDSFDGSTPGGSGGGNSPILPGGGMILPDDQLNAGSIVNATINTMAATVAYFMQKHVPCQVNFTKATAYQTSGTIAGSNLYHCIYDINGNLVSVQRFVTLGAAGVLVGTLTQGPSSVVMLTGDYYFGITIDVPPASSETVLGMQTANLDMTIRNQNGFRNFITGAGFLSGGLVPTSFVPSAQTKNSGGQQNNAVMAVFVEP